jgi:hypothetical protein
MVLTLQPPPGVAALSLGEALEEREIWLSYRSGYLLERNLLQVCLMGEHHRWELEELVKVLRWIARPEASTLDPRGHGNRLPPPAVYGS